jgi:hypothetical protein
VRDHRAVPRRDRVRRRSPVAKWTGRVLGLLGTAVLLAVGVVAATMVVSDDDEKVLSDAPAATRPENGKSTLTSRQREERRAAADELRGQGYAPVSLADYKFEHLLRVLIGKPVGTTPAGLRAFFFVDGRYIGRDATSPSGKLRPGRQREREITLVYTVYEDGDRSCCPTGGEERVHFRWTGEALEPREKIPRASERMPPT